MAITLCPMCKKPFQHDEPRLLLHTIVAGVRAYHYSCYILFTDRLQLFWDVMTGPQEDFDRWLEDVTKGE